MKKWQHHHSIGAGVLVGLGVASYRVWLLLAVCFLAGVLVDRLLVNWRSAKQTASRLLDGRERRANVRTVLERRRSERADARLSLHAEREARRARPLGDLPEGF